MTWARKRYIAQVTQAFVRYQDGMCIGCGEDLSDDDQPFYQVQKSTPPTYVYDEESDGPVQASGPQWHGHANYCVACWDGSRRRSIGPRRVWFWHKKYMSNPWNPLPYLGGDEYGRRTVVLRVWSGAVIIAFGQYRTPNSVDRYLTTPSDEFREALDVKVPM